MERYDTGKMDLNKSGYNLVGVPSPIKVLQISCDINWGSIGRIAEQIGVLARQKGWKTIQAYGRDSNPSLMEKIKVGNKKDIYFHYLAHRMFDLEGLASRHATKELINKIKTLMPDIIHLHNIHDHWLNYEILFEYLNTLSIPVVWTQHDCWSYTGGCAYYTRIQCDRWKTQCFNCPMKQGLLPFIDRSGVQYEKKKKLFNGVNNLTLVPVSRWLEGEIRQSFLASKKIKLIYNGVDVNVFHPVPDISIRGKLNLGRKKILLAVATTWSKRKGLDDYIKLSKILPNDFIIILLGLSKQQQKKMPFNVMGIPRTQNIEQLVELYSAADVVLNLSYEETFGLTTVEGFACGTPGIVYNCTASPELITQETGSIVEKGDVAGVLSAVENISKRGKSFYSQKCRQRAVDFFNKDDRYADYIALYNELLEQSTA